MIFLEVICEERLGWQARTLAGHSKEVNAVTFSPDWKTIATGSRDTLVKLWDVETGAEVRSFVRVFREEGCGGDVLEPCSSEFVPALELKILP